jgi:hypothetical protein
LVPGFVASKRFDRGVKETIDNILAHTELQQEDKKFDAWCDTIIEKMQKLAKEIKLSYDYSNEV